MSSATNGNVDPPDKNIVNIEDINPANEIFPDPNIKSKLSRIRSDDDDASQFENDGKKMKTTSDNFKPNPSVTLCRKSILDTNPFAILDSNEDTEDLAGKISKNINIKQFGVNNHSAKNAQKQRIPPIIITKPFKNPKEAISNIETMLKGKVMFKILKEGYNVTLESLEDHINLKDFLAKQKIPFYTFTSMDKKPLRLVLKGVHHTYLPIDITDDLTTQKVKVLSVQPMYGKGKVSLDMFIVNFEQGSKLSEISKTIKYVCHQSISWHQFIKKDIGTQCRKCQRFGHASSNCGLEYRCVKCTDRHSPGDCPLEDD